MNTIPCITDSDEFRYEPDGTEDTDPRTDAEKRIEWLCEEWKTALTDDTYETWHDVRTMCYGAVQVLGQCREGSSRTFMNDYSMFSTLGDIAFTLGCDCIMQGKYEGA